MNGRMAMQPDKPYTVPQKQLLENMGVRRLKNKLCSAGPGFCKTCQGCAFGREYTKRGMPTPASAKRKG